MGRTGSDENKQANQQMSAIQQDQVRRANAATDSYNKGLSAYEAEGNPYEKSSYKQTERLLAAEGAGAANKAGTEAVESAVGRTGTNATSMPYYRSMMAKERMRQQGDTLVNQNAKDTESANAWKQWLLGAKLAPAGVDTAMFGTATNGRNAALGNLTQLGLKQYDMWGNVIGAAGGAASTAMMGCWIAAALYGGWDAPKTQIVRFWLNQKWAKRSLVGKIVMGVYRRIGRVVARGVEHSNLLRRALQPLFDRALRQAIAEALN